MTTNGISSLPGLLAVIASLCLCGCEEKDRADLSTSGVIEAEETRIGVLMPGKVIHVAAREGDEVREGETLISLDRSQLSTQLKWAEEAICLAEKERGRAGKMVTRLQALLKKARTSKFPRPRSVARSEHKLESAIQPVSRELGSSTKGDGMVKGGQANEMLSQLDEVETAQLETIHAAADSMQKFLQSSYEKQKSALDEARQDARRNLNNNTKFLARANKLKEQAIDEIFRSKSESLTRAYEAEKNAVSECSKTKEHAIISGVESKRKAIRQMTDIRASVLNELVNQRQEVEKSLESKINLLKANLCLNDYAQAQADLEKVIQAGIKNETNMLELQLEQAIDRISMIDTELVKAKALRDELKDKIALCSVKSPVSGVCLSRCVQEGELVAPGPTLMKVFDSSSLHVRVFVPEKSLSRVKVGQSANIHVDGNVEMSLNAKVLSVDSKPSYSPREVFFKDDCDKQAFGVKIGLFDESGVVKPGMRADVIIPGVSGP